MEKIFWRAAIKPGMEQEYRRRHDEIWPEMVAELTAAGIRNYTIWMDGCELFGYYECEKGADFALRYQAESAVVAKWEKEMDSIKEGESKRLIKVFELNA